MTNKKLLIPVLTIIMVLCLTSVGSASAENAAPSFPFSEEKITLTVMVPQTSVIEDWETNTMTLYIEEKTNIDLQFTHIVNDNDFMDKLGLMIAGGGNDLPDIILNAGMDPQELQSWGKSGMIIPLNEYYQKDMYYLAQSFESCTIPIDECLRYMTCTDGNIYALPYYGESTNNQFSQSRIMIYKPWLDKLGLAAPTTVDELVNVLRHFRDDDPNGNGQKDEIPLSSAKNRIKNVRQCLMTPFVYTQGNYYLPQEDGSIAFSFTQDGWREGMRFIKSLIDEGLFDSAFLTQDMKQLTATMSGGDAETVGAVVNISTSNMSGNDIRRYQYVRLAALENTEGKRIAVWEPTMPTAAMLITKNCKYPEIAFRLGDWLCSEELSLFSRYGVEGEDWHYWTEGDPVNNYYDLGKEQVLVNTSNTTWGNLQNTYWAQKAPSVISTRLFFGQVGVSSESTDSELAKTRLENGKVDSAVLVESLNYIDHSKVIGRLMFTSDEEEVVTDIGTPIQSYVEECWARFITGDLDLDNDWDAYLAELEAMGLSEYQQVVQQAYDRTKQ